MNSYNILSSFLILIIEQANCHLCWIGELCWEWLEFVDYVLDFLWAFVFEYCLQVAVPHRWVSNYGYDLILVGDCFASCSNSYELATWNKTHDASEVDIAEALEVLKGILNLILNNFVPEINILEDLIGLTWLVCLYLIFIDISDEHCEVLSHCVNALWVKIAGWEHLLSNAYQVVEKELQKEWLFKLYWAFSCVQYFECKGRFISSKNSDCLLEHFAWNGNVNNMWNYLDHQSLDLWWWHQQNIE